MAAMAGFRPALANYGQYGGSSFQSILIDKTVGKVVSTSKLEFVDNLSPTDPRFAPQSEIVFKLKVKNTSNVKITNVTVKDFVPSFVTPTEGPGTFDESSRVVSFNAGDFDPDQEKIFTLKMKVFAQKDLPANKGLFCLVNKAEARNDQTVDDDTAQFCVEKQITSIPSQVPSAGPEAGILLLTGQLVALGAGFLIKRHKAV
jgi:uncharacterized repeat protein (TIGR01451 family)